ncbi:MAG: ECF transporter S component [Blautia sp.]|jgi:riboflavin transporter FmnP
MSEQTVSKNRTITEREGIKKVAQIGMLCALAYMVMVVIKIPVIMFLKYEPKDVIIALGGFIFGPLVSLVISLVVGVVEMVTVSDTGIIGCIMNILSSAAFACIAAYVYKKEHSRKGAIKGLVYGSLVMTAIMLLWNYLITPLYMGYPREAVTAMLVPVFLPFNLIKAGLNSAILLLIYKPVVTALRKARLISPSEAGVQSQKTAKNFGVATVALVIVATCVLIILSMQGVI